MDGFGNTLSVDTLVAIMRAEQDAEEGHTYQRSREATRGLLAAQKHANHRGRRQYDRDTTMKFAIDPHENTLACQRIRHRLLKRLRAADKGALQHS
jgi:hypothetical protein